MGQGEQQLDPQWVWSSLMAILYIATISPIVAHIDGTPLATNRGNVHQRFFDRNSCGLQCGCLFVCICVCLCVWERKRKGTAPPTLTSLTVQTQREPLRGEGGGVGWCQRLAVWTRLEFGASEPQLFSAFGLHNISSFYLQSMLGSESKRGKVKNNCTARQAMLSILFSYSPLRQLLIWTKHCCCGITAAVTPFHCQITPALELWLSHTCQ